MKNKLSMFLALLLSGSAFATSLELEIKILPQVAKVTVEEPKTTSLETLETLLATPTTNEEQTNEILKKLPFLHRILDQHSSKNELEKALLILKAFVSNPKNHFKLLQSRFVSRLLKLYELEEPKITENVHKILKSIDPKEVLSNLASLSWAPQNFRKKRSESQEKKALIILPEFESKHRNFFSSHKFEKLRASLVKLNYSVETKMITTLAGLGDALKTYPKSSIDFLFLGGHGNPSSIELGHENLTSHSAVDPLIFSSMKEEGKIFLYSCSTGELSYSRITHKPVQDHGINIAAHLSILSGQEVIAPIYSISSYHLEPLPSETEHINLSNFFMFTPIPLARFINGGFHGYCQNLNPQTVDQFATIYYLRTKLRTKPSEAFRESFELMKLEQHHVNKFLSLSLLSYFVNYCHKSKEVEKKILKNNLLPFFSSVINHGTDPETLACLDSLITILIDLKHSSFIPQRIEKLISIPTLIERIKKTKQNELKYSLIKFIGIFYFYLPETEEKTNEINSFSEIITNIFLKTSESKMIDIIVKFFLNMRSKKEGSIFPVMTEDGSEAHSPKNIILKRTRELMAISRTNNPSLHSLLRRFLIEYSQ